jgi:hypothetical protein
VTFRRRVCEGERRILEIPITVELGEGLLAPTLAGLSAVGARVACCTLEVEREVSGG